MNALLVTALLASASPGVTVRVDGPGYLRFIREGRVVFAKSATMVPVGGRLGHASGATLLPATPAPPASGTVRVDADGTVRADAGVLGRLTIAVFTDDSRLMPDGQGFLVADADRPRLAFPGTNGAGWLRGPTTVPATPTIPPPVRSRPASAVRATPSSQGLVGQATRTTVEVRLVTEVSTNQFTLGQIAVLSGPPAVLARLNALVIGDVPPLGVPRPVDQARLRSRLLGAGIDLSHVELVVPDGARVQRPFQVVDARQIQEAATNAARNRYGLAGTWSTGATVVPSPKVGPGTVSLSAVDASGSDLHARVLVHVLVDGVRATSVTVELTRQGVLPPPRVGSNVKVRVRSGVASMETTGTVARSSRSGEPVEVSLPNGERLTGNLIAPNVVEVTL